MIMPATTRRKDHPWKSEVTVEGDSSASCDEEASASDQNDELLLLGERIADLAASINAAEEG